MAAPTTSRRSCVWAESAVDQAYFATQVGKARGVPTLLFPRGEGMDGRHAWFGFLDGNQQWQLNAGRAGVLRFVTGYARDPQTWKEISDHELRFLSERFRSQPAFHTSRVHQQFAADYLANRNPAAAIHAAWQATKFERRNLDAWTTLLDAQVAQGDTPQATRGHALPGNRSLRKLCRLGGGVFGPAVPQPARARPAQCGGLRGTADPEQEPAGAHRPRAAP